MVRVYLRITNLEMNGAHISLSAQFVMRILHQLDLRDLFLENKIPESSTRKYNFRRM